MTAYTLQEDLCEELATLFQGRDFLDSMHDVVKFNIYSQNTPIRRNEDEPDLAPYIIVRLEDGEISDEYENAHVVNVMLIVCIRDDNPKNEGHKRVLTVIHRIRERFSRDNVLKGRHRFTGSFYWTLQEESSFPYFYGGINISFVTQGMRQDSMKGYL